jgi:hypothetical protein
MSTLSGQEHAEYSEHESPPTETHPAAFQDRRSTYSGHEQYSNLAAEGSSRVHAGNSYVEHQTNYYTPPTLAHQPFFGPDYECVQKINALRIALEIPERHLRQANIDRAFAGTCTWLRDTDEYKRRHDPLLHCVHHGMLWIQASPGAGKSTILKTAYKEVELYSPPRSIAFLFNNKGCALEKSTEGMFRDLLCQLLAAPGFCLGMVITVEQGNMEYYKEHGWPLALLKELFYEAVKCRIQVSQPVTCYLDALNEYAEDEARELLSYFDDLEEEPTLSSDLRLCFSNRPYPNMTIGHCETIVLEEHAEHMDDISKYALSRLRTRSFGMSHRASIGSYGQLSSEVIERSSGVFLWVVLVTAQLRKKVDQGVHHTLLRDHLLKIPLALRDLFDTMLDQDDTSDFLPPILQWVLFAQGRLRAIDLYFAVKFSIGLVPETEIFSEWENADKRWLHNFILTSSKGFLRIIDTSSDSYMPCEFIHDSVREYFLNGGLEKLDPSLGSNVVAESHARLAQVCRGYRDICSKHLLSAEELNQKDRPEGSDVLDPVPLLAYIRNGAAFLHAEAADRIGISQAGTCRENIISNCIRQSP